MSLVRCQTRGGRKGGLPPCGLNGFAADAGFSNATDNGKVTGDATVSENVKHLSAHVAIDAQPSIALSHGLALCGQQSMSSIAAMSAMSVRGADLTTVPMTPAAGSVATERAIRSANIKRLTFMAGRK